MQRSSFRTLVATACTLAAVACNPALAETFRVDTSGQSQVIEIIEPTVPVLRFQTQTSGTGSFGLIGYASTDVVNLATGLGHGTNRFFAANGDELLGSFTVQLSPGPTPGTLILNGLTQFTGGTVVFAGATGSATLEAFGQFISDSEALVSFTHLGEITVVPEPATTALLLAGLAAVGGLIRRRKMA